MTTEDVVRYEGFNAMELARSLALPAVVLYDAVGSTLDVAHALGAQGASAGTLVLANSQTAGRGRQGRVWASAPGAGIWLTLIERIADPEAVDVLSLRLGLCAARVLDRFTHVPVGLKWPNDLYVDGRKLAGILVEARWREGQIDWLAVGLGVNMKAPAHIATAGALREGVSKAEVLARLIPALRAACEARGGLSEEELAEYASRDIAQGRHCREPLEGWAIGLDASGAMLIDTGAGVQRARAGSLVFTEEG